MKLTRLLPAAALLLGSPAALPAADAPPAVAAPAAPAKKFTEPELLEALGWLAGSRVGLADFGFSDEELAAVSKGFVAATGGKPMPFKQEEIGEQFSAFMEARQKVAMEKMQAKQAEDVKKNKAAGEQFLAAKKAQAGVTALPSGLLFEVTQPGKGANPKATDTVRVNYTGTLIDGTIFDATSKHTPVEPSEFPLNGVISGWTEGIQKINKGGKIKLYIPSNLAYGDEGRPPAIPPGATLVFEVELLDIK
jgi:FKBP-type peptidyl-prolyl cis-trans isomerase